MVIINPIKLTIVINHQKCGFRHPVAIPLTLVAVCFLPGPYPSSELVHTYPLVPASHVIRKQTFSLF